MTSFFRKRNDLTDQFATIRKAWLHNTALSFAARGILAAITAMDEGTAVTPESIAAMSPESDEVIKSALRELTEAGYLTFGYVEGDVYLDDPDPIAVPEPVTRVRLSSSQGPSSFVYYLQSESGNIKIGFSAHLQKRIGKLQEEHGPLALLATEPGGWHREKELHRKFAAHRIRPDREWFRPGGDLLEHISVLAGRKVSA